MISCLCRPRPNLFVGSAKLHVGLVVVYCCPLFLWTLYEKVDLVRNGKNRGEKEPKSTVAEFGYSSAQALHRGFFFFAEIAFNEVLRVEVQFGPN